MDNAFEHGVTFWASVGIPAQTLSGVAPFFAIASNLPVSSYPVEANEIFVQLPATVIPSLLADGFSFYPWGERNSTTIRLVTAFNTSEADVTALLDATRRYCSKNPYL